ncbi:MAG TPA: carboxypeptidase-like regulatory domain-containing protein [Thermoanaerobaculia bacterium]
MVSRRPAALILTVALPGVFAVVLASSGSREASAQQVSTARFVPTSIPAPPAGSATAPTFSNSTTPGNPGGPGTLGVSPAAQRLSPAAASRPAAPAATGLAGRVTGNASPLAAAGVYAYQLADLALFKVMTDPQGNFLFRDLPAGLYKIIAHKPGFLPVVMMVTRDNAKASQFLELQLPPRGTQATPTTQTTGTHSAFPSTPASGPAPTPPADTDFWALRASIPADVLRDIEASDAASTAGTAGSQAGQTKAATPAVAGLPPGAGGSGSPGGSGRGSTVASAAMSSGDSSGAGAGRFRTEVQAMTGVADVAQVGVGQVSGGKVGIAGQLGPVQVGLSGHFWQMTSDGLLPGAAAGASRTSSGTTADGKTSSLSLDLEAGPSSRITVTSLNNHLLPRTASGPGEPIGLDHYGVSWSQRLGENSHSDFAAQYTSENNYNRQSAIDPAYIPGASRTWNVEGSYTTDLGETNTLQAGFRYSESLLGLASPPTAPGSLAASLAGGASAGGANSVGSPFSLNTSSLAGIAPDHQMVDFFSRGGTRLQPAFLVEYGLYTTLLDGSVSLTPQGGLVLQMDDGWQARGSVTHRVYQENPVNPEFLPALFKESDLCAQGGRSCYELSLSRRAGEDDAITLSALERVVGETLRLYFSDVVFDRLESLYLVPGDKVPEVRLVVNHRLSKQVKTSFESSFATGGGGIFVGADGRPYQNQVRYMVTSLDTRFLDTATGVFLAFQHLTQGQLPLGFAASSTAVAPADFDRLQLMLSQDLSILWNLAAQWALQVNMELSRGTAPSLASTDTALHRRILGGIAVKF